MKENVMSLFGVRQTGEAFDAFCTWQSKELHLGTFRDVKQAANAHDLAALKVALEEGKQLNKAPFNDPSTACWTPDTKQRLKDLPWDDFVSMLKSDAAEEPLAGQVCCVLEGCSPSLCCQRMLQTQAS
jgi:hypothetical protein